ncbi:MAG: NnrU family protein [Pseudomonadota bacterium]
MDAKLYALIAANFGFVATHFLMSHPLRASMVKAFGDTGQQVAYSIVSLGFFVWIYLAFTAAPTGDLPGSGTVGWIVATALTLPAMIMFAGSFAGNPALGLPGSDDMARAAPKGVFNITRHPMMWGFGLWALSHLVLFWSWRTTITAFAMGFMALVGAHMQDRKKKALMGDAWAQWEEHTSYWPRISGFARAGVLPWTLGLVLFAGLSWAHLPLGGIPAGIWRWISI